MAGCRMVWINDSISPAVPGRLAKPAYRRLGKWAFIKDPKWIAFIDKPAGQRLDYLATQLTAEFVDDLPNGAHNASPRVLFLYNTGPAGLTPADVTAYHNQHELRIQQDGDNYATIVFKGDPKTIDFASYYGDYGTDENEGGINMGRAQKMFAISLMTRCR